MNTGMRAQAEYADTMTLDSHSSTSMTLWHFLHSQVADLGPEELLSEFRALQELALASYSSKGDGPTDSTSAGDQKAKCKMNTETEEFLLQQVIASSDEKLQVSALTVVFGSEILKLRTEAHRAGCHVLCGTCYANDGKSHPAARTPGRCASGDSLEAAPKHSRRHAGRSYTQCPARFLSAPSF
jgi:hypothetical protein